MLSFLAVQTDIMTTRAQPHLVTFCQLSFWSIDGYKADSMRALVALKYLGFRVQSLSSHGLGTGGNISRINVIYLCEHTGNGVDSNLLQQTLQGLVHNDLILFQPDRLADRSGQTYGLSWIFA